MHTRELNKKIEREAPQEEVRCIRKEREQRNEQEVLRKEVHTDESAGKKADNYKKDV